MKTSYFAKYKNADGISIAGKCPSWWTGDEYKILAPKYWFFQKYKEDHDAVFYTEQYYNLILNKLNPQEVYDKLKDRVLLCYEKPGDFCHRRIVADWIETELGIIVPEIKYV